MALYPDWLDYAGWSLAGIGLLCLLLMLPQPTGTTRGYLKLSALVLLGVGAGIGAITGILFNLRAPVLHAQGELFQVSHHGGKGSHTDFGLRTPTGDIDGLSISSNVEAIAEGEVASVEYQQFSNRVLGVRIVDGAYRGVETTATNGLFGSCLLLLGSVVLAGYGFLDWMSDGTAIPAETAEDTVAAPDGDVDTQSMLNLNKPD
jgi:hypothetical protein